jgi:hypothetical protein
MHRRAPGILRSTSLAAFFLYSTFSAPALQASALTDAARQLAHKITVEVIQRSIRLEVSNRSSLGESSVREIRDAMQAQLRDERVPIAPEAPGAWAVTVTLSESIRDYVWSAEIMATDGAAAGPQKKIVFVSLPRPLDATQTAIAVVLKSTFLASQEQPILDAAIIDQTGGTRLLLLGGSQVTLNRQHEGRWQQEAAWPIAHSRSFPRDLRGRIFPRRDHLFDAYLPGVVCHSNNAAPASMSCTDSDDPWPLTNEESGVRAFFSSGRNFFTGSLSPGIGKIASVPSFYSATAIPRSGYALWVIAAADGSTHIVDGTLDQLLPAAHWGSDVAAVRSNCGTGTQLLVSESGSGTRDDLRPFEIAEREPAAVGAPLEFAGPIAALWTDNSGFGAIAVVKRHDTGWYEAYRISVACGN